MQLCVSISRLYVRVSSTSSQELHAKQWPQAGVVHRALQDLFEQLPPKFSSVAGRKVRLFSITLLRIVES